MKIAVLGAMDPEIALIKDALTHVDTQTVSHLTFYIGKLGNAEVVLTKCGVGKVAAAIATSVLIDRFNPDYVVNTGSAGGFDPDLEIGDLIIADRVIHHDVDVTQLGFKPGQVYDMPEDYHCDKRLIQAAEAAAQQTLHLKSKQGLVCSGEAFVSCDIKVQQIRDTFPGVSAVEMEGAAIGQTAFLMNKPFVVIRSLSDIAGKSSPLSFPQYLALAAKNSAALVIDMVHQLEH